MKIEPKFNPGDEVYTIAQNNGGTGVIIRREVIDYLAVEKGSGDELVIEYSINDVHFTRVNIFAKIEDAVGGINGFLDAENKDKRYDQSKVDDVEVKKD